MYVFVDTNMKLMFNETGGRQYHSRMDCEFCIFHLSKWCNIVDSRNPLYRWCGDEIYVETSLDIFDL
jgi:hypothetical protein